MSHTLQGVPLAEADFAITQSHALVTEETRAYCAWTYAQHPQDFWHRMSMVRAQSEIASAWEAVLRPYFAARDINRNRAAGEAIFLADKVAQTFFQRNWHQTGAPERSDPLTAEEQAIDSLRSQVRPTGMTLR